MDNALYRDKEVEAMNLEKLYKEIHGDYAEAKARLMNDRLVEKFVPYSTILPSRLSYAEGLSALA